MVPVVASHKKLGCFDLFQSLPKITNFLHLLVATSKEGSCTSSSGNYIQVEKHFTLVVVYRDHTAKKHFLAEKIETILCTVLKSDKFFHICLISLKTMLVFCKGDGD